MSDPTSDLIDALRALTTVEAQLQAIEHGFDSTSEPLAGDTRGLVLDQLVTGLGMLDEYLTGRSERHAQINVAAERLLAGHGIYMLVLSDDRSVLTLDSFPSADGFVTFETDVQSAALRWAALMNSN